MTEEEKERTDMMKTMMIEQEDDDLTVAESIEEFEDKIDYLDIDSKKKNKLRKLCQEIKAEEDEKAQEYLFSLLQKEID